MVVTYGPEDTVKVVTDYSVLSASIGSSFDALRAGKYPATTATIISETIKITLYRGSKLVNLYLFKI